MGFSIGLDDVGYGRSALESLLAVQPEVVKIDQRMVQPVATDRGARRSLEQLFSMLTGIDAEVIAEGVETQEQADILTEIGFQLGQGFLWSHPDGLHE